MWPNPQETADLVTFTEEIHNGNFIFCAVRNEAWVGSFYPSYNRMRVGNTKLEKRLLA